MATKKKDPKEEKIVTKENDQLEQEAPIGSSVSESISVGITADEMFDLEEEAIEIPDIPYDEPPVSSEAVAANAQNASRPSALTSESRSSTPVHFPKDYSQRTRVAREVQTAERAEFWDAEQEDRTTVSVFLTALKEHRILEGVIAGVEANNRTAYWVLYEGPVTVRIPFDNSYMSVPAELVTPPAAKGSAYARAMAEIISRQRQMLDRAKGAKITFTISQFIPDNDGNYVAIGSRTDALSKIRKSYFGPRATQKLKVGDDVIAQILSNGEHAAYITFCGLDVKVKKSDLSHKFIHNVTSTFYVGETLRVRILDITPGTNSNDVPVISVSAKPIEKEKFKKNLKRIHRNGSYIGTAISTMIKSGPDGDAVTISLFLDEVGVPAFSRTTILELGNYIKQGDKVSFLAMGVNEDGYAHGKIIEVIKPRI